MRRLVAALVAALFLPVPAAQAAELFAPLDRPGPALSVPAAKLDAALDCSPGMRGAKRQPVLLSPATGVTVEENYSWNYERAFTARGVPYCTVDMPDHTLGDIQISAEYLVRSIRTMHARAGRRIAVMGHSQGGMSMRWALRFWPDTRRMVDDVVGWAGSNHGTTQGGDCAESGCTPASWQQGANANFIKALNSRAETHPGISYTEVYTHTDEVVTPNRDDSGSSSVHGGGGRITNVATQDICPADVQEHLMVGTSDPVAYALAIDALEHDGPAKESRISPAVCAQAFQPGVNPANADMYAKILSGLPGLLAVAAPVNVVGVPTPRSEPPLRCYVFAACPAGFAQATCLNAGGRARGAALGPVRLGKARSKVRSSMGGQRNRRTRPGLDRYCVRGGGILATGYPTKRLSRKLRRRFGGRAVLALSSSPRFIVAGIRPGQRASAARRRLKGERRYRVGSNGWLVVRKRAATIVVRTRAGRVRAVGLGARSATRGRKATRRFLSAWRL